MGYPEYLSFEEKLQQVLQRATNTTQIDWEDNDHLQKTPARWLQMMDFMTTQDPFEFTTFDNVNGLDEMIVQSGIPFYSLCAHHLVPFYGKAYVGYLPSSKLVGLSKLVRTVHSKARGLWTQEDLTHEIAEYLQAELNPTGVAVVLEAEHLCMSMRGVQTPGTCTTTSAMLGAFGDHTRLARVEFFNLIGKGNNR